MAIFRNILSRVPFAGRTLVNKYDAAKKAVNTPSFPNRLPQNASRTFVPSALTPTLQQLSVQASRGQLGGNRNLVKPTFDFSQDATTGGELDRQRILAAGGTPMIAGGSAPALAPTTPAPTTTPTTTSTDTDISRGIFKKDNLYYTWDAQGNPVALSEAQQKEQYTKDTESGILAQSAQRQAAFEGQTARELEEAKTTEARTLTSRLGDIGAANRELIGQNISSAEMGLVNILKDASSERVRKLEKDAKAANASMNFQLRDRALAEIKQERDTERQREETLFGRMLKGKESAREDISTLAASGVGYDTLTPAQKTQLESSSGFGTNTRDVYEAIKNKQILPDKPFAVGDLIYQHDKATNSYKQITQTTGGKIVDKVLDDQGNLSIITQKADGTFGTEVIKSVGKVTKGTGTSVTSGGIGVTGKIDFGDPKKVAGLGISNISKSIISGYGSLKDLTPTDKKQVIEELYAVGFDPKKQVLDRLDNLATIYKELPESAKGIIEGRLPPNLTAEGGDIAAKFDSARIVLTRIIARLNDVGMLSDQDVADYKSAMPARSDRNETIVEGKVTGLKETLGILDKQKFTIKDPNGLTHEFETQEQLDEFKKRTGLR